MFAPTMKLACYKQQISKGSVLGGRQTQGRKKPCWKTHILCDASNSLWAEGQFMKPFVFGLLKLGVDAVENMETLNMESWDAPAVLLPSIYPEELKMDI